MKIGNTFNSSQAVIDGEMNGFDVRWKAIDFTSSIIAGVRGWREWQWLLVTEFVTGSLSTSMSRPEVKFLHFNFSLKLLMSFQCHWKTLLISYRIRLQPNLLMEKQHYGQIVKNLALQQEMRFSLWWSASSVSVSSPLRHLSTPLFSLHANICEELITDAFPHFCSVLWEQFLLINVFQNMKKKNKN